MGAGEETETQEWLSVSHSASGTTVVKVSQKRGALSVRWSVKAYARPGQDLGIQGAVEEARRWAGKALAELEAVVADT